MHPLTFTVPGKPVGKQRPRVVRRGPHVRTFTPEKTVRFEDSVKVYARDRGAVPHDGAPVGLDVVAVWPWRKADSMRKREHLRALHSGLPPKDTKPDADNVAKAVADALEGVAYVRDGQVAMLRAMTVWGDSPATHVRVWYEAPPPFPEVWW